MEDEPDEVSRCNAKNGLLAFCNKPSSLGELMNEIEKWQEKYDITFQFWHLNNTVYIEKDLVDLYETGGYSTPREAIEACLKWIYLKNRVKIDLRATLSD